MIDYSHWAGGGEQRTCLVLTFSVMADCSAPAPAHHHLMSPPGLAPAAAAGDDVASVRPDSVYILHTVLPRPAQLCFPTLDAAAGWPVIGGASAHSVL